MSDIIKEIIKKEHIELELKKIKNEQDITYLKTGRLLSMKYDDLQELESELNNINLELIISLTEKEKLGISIGEREKYINLMNEVRVKKDDVEKVIIKLENERLRSEIKKEGNIINIFESKYEVSKRQYLCFIDMLAKKIHEDENYTLYLFKEEPETLHDEMVKWKVSLGVMFDIIDACKMKKV